MIYDQFFGKKTLYSVKILKNIHNKLEYLKWCVYGGLAGIHRVGKETYLYHSNKIGKWWSEEMCIRDRSTGILLCRYEML